MLSRLLYFATTFAEAGLSVFGVRGTYEQPPYTVRQTLGDCLEVRDYGRRVAVETTQDGPTRSTATNAAFGRLFDYIAGGNGTCQMLAMTAPVQQTTGSRLIAMTAPVETGSDANAITMRFFLPDRVARAGAPLPNDERVRIVELPPVTLAVLRFSGPLNAATQARHERELTQRLADAPWQPTGAPFAFSYDPPFTIPSLRRNEVAVAVIPRQGDSRPQASRA